MNITNEDYKEGLRDPESLEFLNFAQALRTAVSIDLLLSNFQYLIKLSQALVTISFCEKNSSVLRTNSMYLENPVRWKAIINYAVG